MDVYITSFESPRGRGASRSRQVQHAPVFIFYFEASSAAVFCRKHKKNKKTPPTKIFIDKFFFREAVNHFTRFSFPIKSTHSKLTKDGNGILGTATSNRGDKHPTKKLKNLFRINLRRNSRCQTISSSAV